MAYVCDLYTQVLRRFHTHIKRSVCNVDDNFCCSNMESDRHHNMLCSSFGDDSHNRNISSGEVGGGGAEGISCTFVFHTRSQNYSRIRNRYAFHAKTMSDACNFIFFKICFVAFFFLLKSRLHITHLTRKTVFNNILFIIVFFLYYFIKEYTLPKYRHK